MRNSNYQNIEYLETRPVVRVQNQCLHALGNSNMQLWHIWYKIWTVFQCHGAYRKYDIDELES